MSAVILALAVGGIALLFSGWFFSFPFDGAIPSQASLSKKARSGCKSIFVRCTEIIEKAAGIVALRPPGSLKLGWF